MKKIISIIIALAVALSVCPAALADELSVLVYDISGAVAESGSKLQNGVNEIAVSWGDTVTVYYKISADSAANVSTSQVEIYYDHSFFELVSDSNMVENANFSTSVQTRKDGSRYVFFNTIQTVSYGADATEIGSFQLKVIASSGESTVSSANEKAYLSASESYTIRTQDLRVTVQAAQQSTAPTGGGIDNSADENPSDDTADDTTDDVPTVEGGAISSDTISEAAESGTGLRVEAEAAQVTLSNEALKAIEQLGAENVAVSATAADDGAVTISITADGENVSLPGGVKVAIPAESGKVAILVAADGTETVIKKSLVSDGTANVLLDGGATIKFADTSKTFDDVGETWYTDAVDFATSHELFNGVSDGSFEPEGDMTRAMLVTVLHRLEDEPTTALSGSFDDVSTGRWYSEAVEWASENELIDGYGEGKFGVNDSVTRQQLATILYRYAGLQGLDLTASGDLSGFTDGGETASWASDAMQWAVGAGILGGNGDGTLDPTGTASRAEVAIMFRRLVALMVK
jgi:hypothetical protein